MFVRLLSGIVAALRAVLIPGQAELLMQQPLSWPPPAPPRRAGGDRAYASLGAAER